MKLTVLVLCLFSALVLPAVHAMAAGQEEGIVVLKISPADQRAVVQVAGGKLVTVKPGDTLPGLGRITEIAKGRITCVLAQEQGPETVIIRVNGLGQSISRVAAIPEKRPAVAVPLTATSQLKKKNLKK